MSGQTRSTPTAKVCPFAPRVCNKLCRAHNSFDDSCEVLDLLDRIASETGWMK